MKILFFVIYFLLMGTTHAEVYKCKDIKGTIVYQDEKCPTSSKMSKLNIKEFDKNKIELAQQKLARELEQRAALEAAQAEADREERAIQAIEQRARADVARAYATQRQTAAIDRNTDAVRSKNKIGNVYYYNPRPHPKPYHPMQKEMRKQVPKIKAAGYK